MLFDFLAGLSFKDVVIPVLGLLIGAVGHHYSIRTTREVAADANAEKAKEAQAAAEVAQIDRYVKRELSQSDNLTARFKLLMDGYENQIESLTSEVQALRGKIDALAKSYDNHRIRCAGCPHFQMRVADAAD